MNHDNNHPKHFDEIRNFYDTVYYQSSNSRIQTTRHHRSLVRRIDIQKNQQVLDVACGTGQWLLACGEVGAKLSGVDISEKAINICSQNLKQGEFYCTPAESLPFEDNRFDVVTCLGSLEHFVEPVKALREMIRVARKDAVFVLLVPNADFLTRKLGFFTGTQQADAKEEVRTLEEWNQLFESSGLSVVERWKDLHVLSWSWISLGRWYSIPIRFVQAIALVIWPLKWQYQVYHRCKIKL